MKELAMIFIAQFCSDYKEQDICPPVVIVGEYDWHGMTRNDTIWLDSQFPVRYLKNLVYHEMYHYAFKIPDSNGRDVMNPDRMFSRFRPPAGLIRYLQQRKQGA